MSYKLDVNKGLTMNWQPIKTAPKDGTYILACRKKVNDVENDMWIVKYVENGWTGGRDWRIALDGQCVAPDLWVPLELPNKKKIKENKSC